MKKWSAEDMANSVKSDATMFLSDNVPYYQKENANFKLALE